jgi:hypothetical protein
VVRETRQLNPFTRIEVSGRIDVHITEDVVNSAEVLYGKHLLNGIQTRVIDGVLYIGNNNACPSLRDPKVVPEVWLNVTELKSIYSESGGHIVFENECTSPRFDFEIYDAAGSAQILYAGDSLSVVVHTGASDISVSGSASYAYYYSAGYGPLNASALLAEVSSVHSEGTGDISVRATDLVYYQLFDWGDILVYGQPTIVRWHHKGSGEIISVDP